MTVWLVASCVPRRLGVVRRDTILRLAGAITLVHRRIVNASLLPRVRTSNITRRWLLYTLVSTSRHFLSIIVLVAAVVAVSAIAAADAEHPEETGAERESDCDPG